MTDILGHRAQRDEVAAPALAVRFRGEAVFISRGRWLHPLFELGDFLARAAYDPADLALEDKIVGKAAALLIIRLGIRTLHARTLSRLAQEVLVKRGVTHSYELLVERIDCATESILERIDDPEEAYEIVRLRAGR